MKDIIFDAFQNDVNELLLRHKSILDIITKYSEASSRVNRAVAKSVTNCGCIKISAKKQELPENLDDFRFSLESHLKGKICDNCREIIEAEIGNSLFYLSALCNTLDISLYDVLLKESAKLNILGKFNLE
ncbi:DUF1573 domain-containing protein [Clostridium isatidis]|uniref:DUF1573 domain-containing protein n=1 Tax=Clostridium isatidis TaxID=182773 RepID=A0A343J9C2_9CLOT|nr:DUF1573 domain-containing protein [Clostridium isatidis]ASW42130.1 DUF1573 domain-containing protein [Clostridium isatidis]NLZ33934.1 DUF1573 domain-containing protein [Clostridiales bacterium]